MKTNAATAVIQYGVIRFLLSSTSTLIGVSKAGECKNLQSLKFIVLDVFRIHVDPMISTCLKYNTYAFILVIKDLRIDFSIHCMDGTIFSWRWS